MSFCDFGVAPSQISLSLKEISVGISTQGKPSVKAIIEIGFKLNYGLMQAPYNPWIAELISSHEKTENKNRTLFCSLFFAVAKQKEDHFVCLVSFI